MNKNNKNNEYNNLLLNIKRKFNKTSINKKDINWFSSVLDKDKLKSLLIYILKDEKLLEKIANRSYTHALGFDKIVLMDLKKDIEDFDYKVQLRFHIWDNENEAVPILEAMHEHSFNFISLVLTGKLENQCFNLKDMSETEKNLLIKLQKYISKSSKKEIEYLNEQIEIIEAKRLVEFKSVMYSEQNLENKYDKIKTFCNTGFTEEDLNLLVSIEGHYVSDRVSGERNGYKHILDKYVSLYPENVLTIEKGDYYYHDYTLPHRLYYDNKILNSTILLTTPALNNPQGGSLQRPTYQTNKEKEYLKIKLDKKSLYNKIEKYLLFLE